MKYERKQIIQYLTGIVLTPMGVVLTINSHAGAGGYDALNFAIADRSNSCDLIYISR